MYEVISSTDNLLKDGKVSSIHDYIIHEDYNGFSNDIALIFASLIYSKILTVNITNIFSLTII